METHRLSFKFLVLELASHSSLITNSFLLRLFVSPVVIVFALGLFVLNGNQVSLGVEGNSGHPPAAALDNFLGLLIFHDLMVDALILLLHFLGIIAFLFHDVAFQFLQLGLEYTDLIVLVGILFHIWDVSQQNFLSTFFLVLLLRHNVLV